MKTMMRLQSALIDTTTEVTAKHTPIVHEFVALLEKHGLESVSYQFNDKLVGGVSTVTVFKQKDGLDVLTEMNDDLAVVVARTEQARAKGEPLPALVKQTSQTDPKAAIAKATSNVSKVRICMQCYAGQYLGIEFVAEQVNLTKRQTQDILWRLWKDGELNSKQDGIYMRPLSKEKPRNLVRARGKKVSA